MAQGNVNRLVWLNDQILQMHVVVSGNFSYQPGQWALLGFIDTQGPFKRAYSLLDFHQENTECEMVFVIKVLEEGRAGKIFRKIKEGDSIEIQGIYGHFVLQETSFPKVFMGIGTGIVPLYAMAKSLKEHARLFFSVSYIKDLYLVDEIRALKHIDSRIHISREQKEGFELGRIDLTYLDFALETEFYLCGKPEFVDGITTILKERGHTFIFSEKY